MTPALDFHAATVVRGGRAIVDAVDWACSPTSAGSCSVATAAARPRCCAWRRVTSTRRRARSDVLGGRLGRVDVRELRARIGLTSAALADQLRPTLDALDVVMTAKHAALEPWWHRYTDDDRSRAAGLLDRLGVGAWPIASSARCRRASASACCWPAR
jgi:iron complex transport system ATP-binding protein